MKCFVSLVIALALAAPASAFAQKKVDEYGEDLLSPDIIEQVAPEPPSAPAKPAKSTVIQERDVSSDGAQQSPKAASKAPPPPPVEKAPPEVKAAAAAPSKKKAATTEVALPPPPPPPSGPIAAGREKRIRTGVIGPGFGYFSRGYGAAMTMGFEGEYFFFERLSAGMRFELATRFKQPTWLSFVPQARYIFDFDRHPRFAAYAQAGVGLAISAGDGTFAAVDIAIPGGGVWWQWTDRFSIGAETNLHILARSSVTVGWTIAPVVRYTF